MQDPRGAGMGRQGISHMQKREILWNIIQPGDPFDIKRSMIAKLPGDRKTFMGAHLQLVCLLQAAQIERLCEYLEEYKLRYRQIERVELDRHSYEIQIKELTMQLADESSFKSQNQKLRDFIKKLTLQLEDYRKKAGNETDLMQKYQSVLSELENMRGQSNRLIHERRAMLSDIQHLNAQIKAMQAAKLRQIEDLKHQLSDSSKIAFDRERRELTMRFESQINRLEYDNKRLRDSNDAKNRQIEELQHKNRQLYAQIEEEVSKNEKYAGVQKVVREYESRFGMLGQQVERLNLVLREKTDELNDFYNRSQHMEIDIQRRDSHISELQSRIGKLEGQLNQCQVSIREYKAQMGQYNESKRVIEDYENRLGSMGREIERLNQVLKKKVNENDQMVKRLQQLQFEYRKIDLIGRQNEELKRGVQQISDLRRKLAEYENKLALLTQEIERLNQVLRNKVQAEGILQNQNRGLTRDLEIARSKINEIEQSMNYSLQSKVTNYEQRIQAFSQQNDELRSQLKGLMERSRQVGQFQMRLKQLSQQIERLNGALRGKVDEVNKAELTNRNLQIQCQNYKRRISQIQNHLGGQLKSKVLTYEQKNSQLNRRISEYQNKMALLSQQIERLNHNLRGKVEQCGAFDQRNRHLQQQLEGAQRKIMEINHEISESWRGKVTTYEQRITQFQQENQDLRRRMKELSEVNRKISEYENKIVQLSGEVDRLNSLLERYTKDNSSLNQKLSENEQLRVTITNLQSRLDQIFHQNKRMVDELRIAQENHRNCGGQIQELTVKITQIISERDECQRRLRDYGENEHEIRRRVGDYQNKMGLMSQQIQRLNGTLRAKLEELHSYENRYKQMSVELQNAKKRFGQSETIIIQQWRSKVIHFEQQNDDLRRRIAEYENKVGSMSQEIDRLNQNLRGVSEDYTHLDQKYHALDQRYHILEREHEIAQRRISEIEGSMSSQLKTRTSNYEQTIVGLRKQNDQFRRRFAEYEKKMTLLSQEVERLNQTLRSKVEQCTQTNSRLRSTVGELEISKRRIVEVESSTTHEWQSRVTTYQQRLQSYNQENDDLKRRLSELLEGNRKLADYESKLMMMSQQIDRLNHTLKAKVQEANNYEQRVRTYESEIQEYHRRIDEYEAWNSQMKNQVPYYERQIESSRAEIEQLKRRLQDLDNVTRKIAQYQNRSGLMNQEIDRLNQVLRVKIEEVIALEQQRRILQTELEEARRRIGDTEVSIVSQWKAKLTVCEQQIISYTQDNEQLRRRVKELTESNRKIPDYEGRLMTMSQEIERLNQALRSKVQQLNECQTNNRSLWTDLETSKRRINEVQSSIGSQWRSKVSIYEQKVTSYTQENDELRRRINQLLVGNQKLADYENKLSLSAQEIERLNQILRGKLEELNNAEQRLIGSQKQIDSLRRKQTESQSQIVSEWRSKVTFFEQQVTTLNQENQEFRRRLKQLMDANRRISQYEAKIAIMSQELERLNGVLRQKVDQCANWEQQNRSLRGQLQNARRKITDFQSSVTTEFKSQITIYEQRINAYEQKVIVCSEQNDDLRRRVKELLVFESRCTELGRQIQRLNSNLRSIQIDYESRISSYESRIQGYEQRVGGFEKYTQQQRKRNQQLIELNRRLAEYQNKMALLSQEIQRLNSNLRGKVEELNVSESRSRSLQQEIQSMRRNTGDYEGRASKLLQEIERLNSVLKDMQDKNYSIGMELEGIKRKQPQYLSDIERLNNTLRLKVEEAQRWQTSYSELQRRYEEFENRTNYNSVEYQKLQTAYNMVSGQYEKSKRHIADYETSIQKLYAEFERLQTIMQELKRENHQLKLDLQRSDGTHEKNHVLSAEIDRLNIIIEQQREDISELRLRMSDDIALQKRINEHMALMVVLFAEIESLRKRVKDKEKEVQQVRRSSLAPFKV